MRAMAIIACVDSKLDRVELLARCVTACESARRARGTGDARCVRRDAFASARSVQKENIMIRWGSSIAGAILIAVTSLACGSSTSPTTVSSLAVAGQAPAVGDNQR